MRRFLGRCIALALLLAAPGVCRAAATTDAGGDMSQGNPKAKVTVVEYASVACPICGTWFREIYPQFKAKYIDTGKVFYVFRVFPLRADDGTAEKIARCLPEDKYFSFIDLLFRNQPKWDVEYGVTDVHAGLVLLGRIAGMSGDQVAQVANPPPFRNVHPDSENDRRDRNKEDQRPDSDLRKLHAMAAANGG